MRRLAVRLRHLASLQRDPKQRPVLLERGRRTVEVNGEGILSWRRVHPFEGVEELPDPHEDTTHAPHRVERAKVREPEIAGGAPETSAANHKNPLDSSVSCDTLVESHQEWSEGPGPDLLPTPEACLRNGGSAGYDDTARGAPNPKPGSSTIKSSIRSATAPPRALIRSLTSPIARLIVGASGKSCRADSCSRRSHG